jgi:nesprin-1
VSGSSDDTMVVLERQTGELSHLEDDCNSVIKAYEDEIAAYHAYHQSLQEVEKWLLQISFQLMAHNSLYITTKEQTMDQFKQHDKLMQEIKDYQAKLDTVRDSGLTQVARYGAQNPALKQTVDTQNQNFQESYNSLLQTSTQIRNRLTDSIAKFQEYEDTLENIIKNLEVLEPQIKGDIRKPLDEIVDFQSELENMKVRSLVHLYNVNMLF